MVNRDRLVSLFKELCLINAPALEERECVDFMKHYLSEAGIEHFEDEAGTIIGGNAGNVIATVPGNKPGAPRIFLSAHFDTVEPTANLTILEEDGILKSDGSTILGADDKGGMAPIIEAIHMLRETQAEHGDIVLLFSVSEEIGLKGAEALKIEDLNLDFGYVLDTGPPVGTFVTRTATHDKIDFLIHGKPAHAGKDPENGINAISVMAEAVSHMKVGRVGPETTSNLGIVTGGTAVNVVCPFVHIRGEARSTSVAELDAQVDHMIQCMNDAAEKFGTTVEITHHRHYNSYHVADDAPVVRIAQQAARKLGFTGDLRTTLGGSDANKYNAKGVPSIVVATGMEKIHTHEEQISIESLVQTAELIYAIVLEAANPTS